MTRHHLSNRPVGIVSSLVALGFAISVAGWCGQTAQAGQRSGEREVREAVRAKQSEKLRDIEAEAVRLLAAGKIDEATRLAHQAQEIRARLQQIGEDAEKKMDAQAAMKEKLQRVGAEIAELRAAGKKEEAERLAQVAAELKERLASLKAKPELPEKGKDVVAEAKREKHEALERELRELWEAGKMVEVKELMAKLMAQKAKDQAVMIATVKGAKPGADDAARDLGQAVKELRTDVARLRDEVAELRRIVKKRGDQPKPDKSAKKQPKEKPE